MAILLPRTTQIGAGVVMILRNGRRMVTINETNRQDRKAKGKEAHLRHCALTVRSLKLTPMIYEHRGLERVQKHDAQAAFGHTDGRLYGVMVHAANIHDGKGAQPLLNRMMFNERLEKIVGDDAYAGASADAVSKKLVFESAQAQSVKGFVPIAKRWVVERTIAWTNFFRDW